MRAACRFLRLSWRTRASRRLLVARLRAREPPAAQIFEGLLDLRAGVHHEGTVARDRLLERSRGGEQEASAARPGRGFDDIALAEDDERRRVRGLLLGPEANFAVVDVRERRVAPRHPLAERGARRQHAVDELR